MILSLRARLIALGVTLIKQPFWIIVPFFIAAALATAAVRHHFFFWDTAQLGAEHALFFYTEGFHQGLLPDAMDSGHPPVFGWYLAGIWHLCGRSLAVSHWAMLPFLWGIIWMAWRLGRRLLGDGFAVVWLILLCLHPVMAAQSLLVSPDVVLIFFFFLSLIGIYEERKLCLSIGILGLFLISMRGMMVATGLFFIDILCFSEVRNGHWREGLRRVWLYGWGGLAAVLFFGWHYVHKGWIGYHGGSAWAQAFERAQGLDWLKNAVIMGWRLTDFGNIGFLCVVLMGFITKKTKIWPETRRLQYLLLGVAAILLPILMAYRGLLTHRYILPVYILVLLLGIKAISDLKKTRQKWLLLGLCSGLLLSGHFWVYPQPIATGWDATTAHLPYYQLHADMCRFLSEKGISWSQVGSHFPNLRPLKMTHLSEENGDKKFQPIDFNLNKYIFYSNVMNDFSEKDLSILRQEWRVVKSMQKGQVVVCLYEKK